MIAASLRLGSSGRCDENGGVEIEMDEDSSRETVVFWDKVAAAWDIQVGERGDINRRLNSDPVLWHFAGDIEDLDVLDAGCGTGYLTRQLAQRGARAIGIDVSAKMIEIARTKAPHIDFRVDSCTELATVDDESVNLILSNYVLMDVPDLEASARAFVRVLRPGGTTVVIFSHPCFPQGRARGSGSVAEYVWEASYFEERKRIDPPWGHFTSEFIWFHRPLSGYWKAFNAAGLEVADFDEPRIAEESYHLAGSEKRLEELKTRPMSVAFKLRKPERMEGR